MILSGAIIGLIVGTLLGLTGAGGAVIAIPLLIHLTGATLRDATVISLLIVAMGALLSWLVQRKNTDYATSFMIFAFSLAGSLALKPLKAQAPSGVILALLTGVTALSLFFLWKPRPPHAPSAKPRRHGAAFLAKGVIGGFALGALVTMTGLGGGVILVPLLVAGFGLSLHSAAATSLFTIILTSLSSMAIQWESIARTATLPQISALFLGSALSVLITQRFLKSKNGKAMERTRKIILTVVILISIASLYIP